MLKPPAIPANVLLAGKVAVLLTWVFCGVAVALPLAPGLATIGQWLGIGLLVSHAIEIAIFRAFLQAAKATPLDYALTLVFGVFHSGGMKAP